MMMTWMYRKYTLSSRNLSDLLINSNTCLNLLTFCSYERFGQLDIYIAIYTVSDTIGFVLKFKENHVKDTKGKPTKSNVRTNENNKTKTNKRNTIN